MQIHTLGPKTTDSYNAYQYACQHLEGVRKYDVSLHPSFQDIYAKLDQYHGDLFLVPVAYRNSDGTNWTDNNLIFGQQLSIVNCFHLPLRTMVLVQNKNCQNGRSIIHPSTIGILNNCLPTIDTQKIKFVTSKPLALSTFLEQHFQFGIFSYGDFEPHDTDQYQILTRLNPHMIWCLYQIK
ncbi:hypothetical protein MOO44_00210 (plasmid) [Nicoliella spurrieriana]|uniref:Prephenate dehydratase n=1 Tax=Nicoliella spurrieriana TaxID=2925830 RepID=A0A976X524_9LACO|nr:hypothetical protein [Nicoliella spurrieriana]UQS86102.1 hypothetical protein MOO44_00210 [Nicoliella spurrieriana]